MAHFPFYNVCVCSRRKGAWTREDNQLIHEDINIFPSWVWGDYDGCCEFLSSWLCCFPCPFCQTPHRHRWRRMSKNHSNIAVVCPCQLESRLSPDDDRDRTVLCLLPAWSLLSLPRKQPAQQENSGPADKHAVNK